MERLAASSFATSDRENRSHLADAVVLGTGGYGNVFISTNAKVPTAPIWRAYKRGAAMANLLHANPSDVHTRQRRLSIETDLMSESLRNDGRIWVPLKKGDKRPPNQIRKRARLLPRTPLSQLWKSGAARRRIACGESGVR
jgi:succinate dehydrogenase / fumarate reductase flavoprotein subunit